MTSSRKERPVDGDARKKKDELPAGLSSMWRLCKLGYQHEPQLIVAAFSLSLLSALPDALLALWFKWLGEGAIEGNWSLVRFAAIALGVSAAATWILQTVSTRVQRRFRDKVTIALESHVATLLASIATIAHQERPEYLDRLAVLRNQVFMLDHMYMSLFTTCAWILRLVRDDRPPHVDSSGPRAPRALCAADRVDLELAAGSGAKRLRARRAGEQAGSPSLRRRDDGGCRQGGARHRYRRSPRQGTAAGMGIRESSHRGRTMALGCLAHGGMGDFRCGLCRRDCLRLIRLRAPAGDVLLALAAGSRLSYYVGATVGEIGFLRGIWMDAARRLAWLEDYASSLVGAADQTAPARLAQGVRFEHVSFAYPGTERLVLDDVNVEFPAGSVVAIVGENGAGKSTLVKLLAKMYEPTSGRILVDDIDLARISPVDWRARLAGAFQDFFRFEFRARHTVGVGDVPRIDDQPAVVAAVSRAGADDVIVRLTGGLETQLGPSWPDGVDVSFGQWQKLALARGFMRDEPLVLVLDEPTAALDAETEHALFERYAAALRGDRY